MEIPEANKYREEGKRRNSQFWLNVFIAGIPMGIFVTVMLQFGVRGASIPLIGFAIFTPIIGAIRVRINQGKVIQAWKTILWTLLAYFIVFFVLPIAGIALLD